MTPLFTGCGTAIVTPFKNGEIDYPALDNLVEFQLSNGVDAIIACGTTGEPATMTWEEHLAVVRRVVDVVNHRVPVIAGTGSNSTREAVDAARASKSFGADAQLVVTPYYNKTSQEGLIAHYNALADAATLPVIVYNVPGRTGLNISASAMQAICKHPNVIGVKEASGNVAQILDKMRLVGDDAVFYSGSDEVNVPLMSCGFVGCISVLSNIMPKETADMMHAALNGDYAFAGKEQMRLMPIINALFSECSPIPCKAALSAMGMMDDDLRLPLVPMTSGNREKMYAIMRELGLIA